MVKKYPDPRFGAYPSTVASTGHMGETSVHMSNMLPRSWPSSPAMVAIPRGGVSTEEKPYKMTGDGNGEMGEGKEGRRMG